MIDVRVRHPVAPADVDVVRSLATAAEAADGHPAVGDSVWRSLDHPGPGTTLLVAYEGEQPVGALHATTSPERSTLAVVVDPTHRQSDVARELLTRGIEVARTRGSRAVVLWAFGADERADACAESAGFDPARELWQMRVPLPLGEPVRWPPGIAVRPFDPARDEDAWLAVNNRAFRDDPDQGGWTIETLRQREQEPWFEPTGLLLAHDAHGLAGFCWTKVHRPAPPREPTPLGEIYVIGVDPDRQGTGLGRALVVGGLTSLHRRGIGTGMLFVDAANAAAVGLYRALGFAPTRVDRAYERALS